MIEPGEIADKIQADVDVFGGTLPADYAMAWAGYIAALRDSGVLKTADYESMLVQLALLSKTDITVPNDVEINAGGDDQDAFGKLDHYLRREQSVAAHAHDRHWNLFMRGYLAALLEQDVLDFGAYSKLLSLVPRVSGPDPVATIFSGRLDADELLHYVETGKRSVPLADLAPFEIAWKSYLDGLLEYGAISRSTLAAVLDSSLRDTDARVPPEIAELAASAPKEPTPELVSDLEALLVGAPRRDRGLLAPDAAWKSYLLALKRWQVLTQDQFEHLAELLPSVDVPRSVWNHAFGRDAGAP